MIEDKALILRLQNKDEKALSLIYDRYSRAIYGVIIRMCKDEDVAKNLLQDTFMTIWEKSNTYDYNKGRFYTWAYRIAKNKTLNYLRKPNNLIQMEDMGVYENKADAEIRVLDFIKLKGSITQLEAHHQKAIELVFFNGLTHMQAHKEMDVPLGTFKSYIRQALKLLKQTYMAIFTYVMVAIEVFR